MPLSMMQLIFYKNLSVFLFVLFYLFIYLYLFLSIYIGNADEIDVVPSSNPNSPDTYITDQKMSWTATPNIFLENYNKVDLKQYCTVNGIYNKSSENLNSRILCWKENPKIFSKGSNSFCKLPLFAKSVISICLFDGLWRDTTA